MTLDRRASTMPAMLVGILKSMRPHQWVKNLFVLAPLVFAQQLGEVDQILRSVGAMALFCAASSAVYLTNDVFDIEKDRAHPVKRHRPIPSGSVPLRAAVGVSLFLALLSVLGGLLIAPALAGVTLVYLLMNLAYSFRLKHLPYLDVATIAFGFLLRVHAGAVAIDVPIGHWLVLCTFLVSLYLGLGKRRHELMTARDGSESTRRVLDYYRISHLNVAMFATALATTAAYTAYTLDPHTTEMFGSDKMPWTIPFTLFGILRFLVLTGRPDNLDSPTDQIVRDIPFVMNLVAWGFVVLYVIYFQ